MKPLLFALLLGSVPAFAADGFQTCELEKWRDAAHEKTLIDAHPKILSRTEDKLRITLQNGKAEELEDADSHRVIAVNEAWVALVEPTTDSLGYRIVFLKSGKSQELDGCPIFSSDGKYFVSL